MAGTQRSWLGNTWLPVGEEPQPAGSITECRILRSHGISAVSLADGNIDADRHGSTGFYHNDTRYLSRLSYSLGGVEPILLDATLSGPVLSAIFTNRAMAPRDHGERVPGRALVIRRRRILAGAMYEILTVSNYASHAVQFDVSVELAADFADIFEVRGFQRSHEQQPAEAQIHRSALTYRYAGADGQTRCTNIRFSREPDMLGAEGAVFSMRLEPRTTESIEIRVAADMTPKAMPFQRVLNQARNEERNFLAEMTSIVTDDDRVNDALHRALLDIAALQTESEGSVYTAAGVPWFDTLFGRDSLITGMLLAPFNPGLLRSSLLLLARYQAQETEPERDSAPGKIPHELRWGELAQTGEVPFGRYYGSVDSTPLFLMAAGEYYDWTGDADTILELWPAMARAWDWCSAAVNSQGLLGYQRNTAAGLENQGWKDSHDAVAWPDGSMVEPPITLVEVQGYLAAGLMAFQRMADTLRMPGAGRARAEVWRLLERIERTLAVPGEGYAFCLDGAGKQVPTAVSNPAHLLWSGAASPDRARETAQRLMAPDMFSGWGIRTMSAESGNYNPLGYHTGSVWPHDNAIAVGGLRRYGFDAEAVRLATAFVESVLAFPGYQVPELFSGDERGLRLVPTPYPVASRPQAWSAASLPYVLASLLGLRPREGGQVAIIRPVLPDNVTWARVRNLRCHGGSVDLLFRRQGDRASVEVEQVHGNLEVILSNLWPSRLIEA